MVIASQLRREHGKSKRRESPGEPGILIFQQFDLTAGGLGREWEIVVFRSERKFFLQSGVAHPDRGE